MPEVAFDNLSLAFGDVVLLEHVSLQIEPGERIGLLGRNGSGKSTLMKLLAGEIEPDDGEVSKRQGVIVTRLAQEVPHGLSGSVRDVLTTPFEGAPAHGEWETEARIDKTASQLDLDPEAPVDTLSAGTQRRVLLGRALVQEPDLLLLDEPTNHLDIETVQAVEELLLRRSGSLVFVTHDRAFLRRLSTRILDLDRGLLRSYSCDYETYLKRKSAELAAEAANSAEFDKKLAREEAWIRRGIKARRTRNEGRVRQLEELRRQRVARRNVAGNVRARVHEADRSGRVVIRADDISHSFDGGETKVIDGFSAEIQRGDRIGIIGPNGSGKTTLIRVLLEELKPLSGNVHHGTNLEIVRFDQLHSTLDETKTVQENVCDDSDTLTIAGRQRHVIGYLQDFLFTPGQIRGSIKQLSGGERNRLQLARVLARPCNVLVLDEPTNDLDLETLEILEDMLLEYTGTLLLVSHDREFLNNVVTSTLVFEGEGEGTVNEYFGGYDDWLLQRKAPEAATPRPAAKKKSAPSKSEQPRRLTYKEKMELEALPKQLEDLEAKRDQMLEAMSDPEFFKRDGSEIAAEKARLEEIDRELADAFDRWELLESVAEGK